MVYKGNDSVEQHIIDEFKKLIRDNDLLNGIIKNGTADVYCAVCGEKIEQLSIQRMTRPVLWHDRVCIQWKPRKIVWLERKFGKDIVEILQDTAARCGNIKAQCDVLDVSIPYLYSIIKKYCGDLIPFMAKYGTGKRRELYAKKIEKQNQDSSEG